MFPLYFETILSGAVLARMALMIVIIIDEPGYKFRKLMVMCFIGIYLLGKVHEIFNFSAYHEEQGQAVGGLVVAIAVYIAARFINESRVGVAMRKVLYWTFVGDLKTDVSKSN